jgi:hypothetical protein
LTFFSLSDKIGVISTVCPRHRNSNDCKAEFDSGGYDILYNVMVRAFICEGTLNSLNWVFTLYGIVTSEYQHIICKYVIC